jgi:hypothetical protein
VFGRVAQVAAASLAIAGSGIVSGCLTRPIEPVEPKTTSTIVERLTESAVDKIDLLLMIDNSRSMADKQAILVEAVPDLVTGLVNPKCIDPDKVKPPIAVGASDMCPDGYKRDFPPVQDIHIGIITSSLGGHASDACPDNGYPGDCPSTQNHSTNDYGHLVTRTNPCAPDVVPTYQNKGFLAWDPTGKKANPPGEANIGELNIDTATGTVTTVTPGLVPSLKDLVLGTGQIGCGYEAQHESWYRFLIDPDPYQSIAPGPDKKALPSGKDAVLLQQRADFLRPSSLLAIIGLTDENDCSIKEYGQFYLAAQQRRLDDPNKNFHLPKPRSECATNPNDKCCASCGQTKPDGCPDDPVCATGNLDDKTDDVNLRCWDQKRRFGIDFLYPIDRYVAGLTQALVPNRTGEMVQNPIFSDLNPSDMDGTVRDPSLVFLAYITGVPWQDIARDPKDLTKGFLNASELGMKDDKGNTRWDYILGDPANYVAPLDPHMIESDAPRSGTNPITGDTIAPPSMTEAGPDALNGHEYTPGTQTKNGMSVQVAPDDLQYACIFKLPQPRDCSDPSLVSCDCPTADSLNDNPLCADNGTKGRTLQTHAKAYPGIRELQLIQKLGSQGIVGSICPAQLNDLTRDDFGYRPAIGAIIDRLKVALGGQCLPRQLNPNPTTGEVGCLILEGRNTSGAGAGSMCDAFCKSQPGRQPVAPEHQPALQTDDVKAAAKNSNLDCFCELTQTSGDDLTHCQQDVTAPASVYGWCYVDATIGVGNPELVATCPDTERRLIRFVGNQVPATGATLFITCSGE